MYNKKYIVKQVIEMKKIAVINDISGFGKCSLTAALPIISAHKIQCCPLPTGVFSNQTGYDSFKSADMTEYLPSFIEEWKKLNPSFDGILTGFIPSARQGKIIIDFINEFKKDNTFLAVDPIMGDDKEIYPCYNRESINAVTEIAKRADLITPNVTELALLCKRDIKKDYTLIEIEEMCKSLNNRYIAVTGIELDGGIANAVYDGKCFEVIKSERIGSHYSGTGDIFSSYVISECVNGNDIFTAVARASEFIEKAIKHTKCNDKQHYNPDGIEFERFLGFV